MCGDGDNGLEWRSSMKVSFGDEGDEGKYPCRVGDVGGVWKSSIGVNDNSFVGEEVFGLLLGDDDVVVRFSKSWRVCVLVSHCLVEDVGLRRFR